MSFPANPANTSAVGVGVIVGELVGLPAGGGDVDCVSGWGGLVMTGSANGESDGVVVAVGAVAVDIAAVDV